MEQNGRFLFGTPGYGLRHQIRHRQSLLYLQSVSCVHVICVHICNSIEYRSVTSQLFIDMETGSKQFQAVCGSVITTVANNTSTRLQPTASSLVQGSLV